MKCLTKKLRSPLKWHGGKSYLARRIISLFPSHRVYVEPFLGGGSILLNKPRVEREIAGDLNEELMGFWWTLQNKRVEFLNAIADIPYSRESWYRWVESEQWGNVSQAVQFLVRNRFSRGGLGKDFAWSDRLRGGQPGDVNAWDTIRTELPAIAERISEVEFDCGDALGLIRFYGCEDGPICKAEDTLIYCDPPYLHETRTAKKAYGLHEMSGSAHIALLETLKACRGKVFISGYPSGLYASALSGWKRHEFDMPNHSGQGKTKARRLECVWESPD